MFIDDSDLRPAAPAAPQIIYQSAPRSMLVPALLVLLIVAVLALAFVMVLPHLNLQSASPKDNPVATTQEIDPKLLTTPSGRKLEVVEFGGFLFEVTRLTYHQSQNMRSVTITVPGDPPPIAVFHVGDSFAGGKIRIVDINETAVVLESGGQQKMFPRVGANLGELYDPTPSGTRFMPARGTSAIPDLPVGAERAPVHPLKEIKAEEAAEPKAERKSMDTYEELPWEEHFPMRSDQYLQLVRELREVFERDFVLAVALDRETRMPWGLEIKNIRADSMFYARGLQRGDVIYGINGHAVRRITELNEILRGAHFREEICIEVERGGETVAFVFFPGVPD